MSHNASAKKFLSDVKYASWHDKALWFVREKRDKAIAQIEDWEALRTHAAAIKAHTISKLDFYLEKFEKNAHENGSQVHWAEDADDLNSKVLSILEHHSANKILKTKSNLTEECGLDSYLEHKGIEIIETDLGERIIQLAGERPSHLVAPAIHKRRNQIAALFHDKLGANPNTTDPEYLTRVAREALKPVYKDCKVALTGANFAIAETGGVVLCTNEGNADIAVNNAEIHIACIGIEKVIPTTDDLGVFVRMLARSATGQAITAYTSHFRKASKGKELHVIFVDNGRIKRLEDDTFRSSLHCIKCGACLNTCPVFRRSGGHSYNYPIPGPIGAIIAPHTDISKYGDLPFASTLCGSCTNVCPVKINIHEQLYSWRQRIEQKNNTYKKSIPLKWVVRAMEHPSTYDGLFRMIRWGIRRLPRFVLYSKLNIWGRTRQLPEAPKESFKDWYIKNRK